MSTVWIIQPYDPTPTRDNTTRLGRYGLLAEKLVDRGHQVVRFRSAFDGWIHKRFIHRETVVEQVGPNYDVVFIRAPGYQKNISLKRLWDSHQLAKNFAHAAKQQKRPDLILCAMPTIDLCLQSLKFGKALGIPVVVDIRDLWPDIFARFFKCVFRPLAPLFLWPFRRQLRKVCRQASGLCAITDAILNWGLTYAKRPVGKHDCAFVNAYPGKTCGQAELEEATRFWQERLPTNTVRSTACYVGTMRGQMELETVIDAYQQLGEEYRVIIAGEGPTKARCQALAQGHANIIITDWLTAPQVQALLQLADFGLAPYRSTMDFMLSYPTKIPEYLSAGLPIVSCLKGETEKLLKENACGLVYENEHGDALKNCITQLTDQTTERQRMGENAKAIYDARFDANTVYDRMSDYLEGFL